jgi:hypothetical protein
MYRKLAEQTDDPFVKNELLELASVCDEVANNIEDHLIKADNALRAARSDLTRSPCDQKRVQELPCRYRSGRIGAIPTGSRIGVWCPVPSSWSLKAP